MHSTETRAKIREGLKKYYADPAVKVNHSGIMKNRKPILKVCDVCHNSFETTAFNAKRCSAHRDHVYAESALRGHLKRDYNLDWKDYLALLERTGNKCEICDKPGSEEKHGRLSVDHDHATGEVRGLLCERCNFGIGKFQDNPDILRNAIEYLQACSTQDTTDPTTQNDEG